LKGSTAICFWAEVDVRVFVVVVVAWWLHTVRWLGFFFIFFFFKASADDLRVLLAKACGGSAASSESASFAVANFDRGSLGMEGSGHFSPVVSELLGSGVLF
jgi:hypothetical protein